MEACVLTSAVLLYPYTVQGPTSTKDYLPSDRTFPHSLRY